METSVKTRENRLRRQLSRTGHRLCKTPARSWLRSYYDVGYMIVKDTQVVQGCGSREYENTLEEIEYFGSEIA